ADTRPGYKDKEKREKIRKQAARLPRNIPEGVEKCAFRISVSVADRRRFDIENVVKLIIDAFCIRQIQEDESQYRDIGLYADDTIDHVVVLQVEGERT